MRGIDVRDVRPRTSAPPSVLPRGHAPGPLRGAGAALAPLRLLYTDSQCTYQFYDGRGFERAEERSVRVGVGPRHVPLDCYLYAKPLLQRA